MFKVVCMLGATTVFLVWFPESYKASSYWNLKSLGKIFARQVTNFLLTLRLPEPLSGLQQKEGTQMKLHIPDMSCSHCVATIEKAVKAADPSATVRPDLTAHTAEIETSVSSASLIAALEGAGYPSTAL